MGLFSSIKGGISRGIGKITGNGRFTGTVLGGLVGGPFGVHYGSQFDILRQQNEIQNAQIERQNQLNMEMWNLQNEYNSPAAQMKRYKDAGLNPNLIYGSVTSGNASDAPEMTATGGTSNALALASVINQASGDVSNFIKGVASKMLGNYFDSVNLDLAQKQANVRNTNAATKKVLESVNTQGNTYKPSSVIGKIYEDIKHISKEGANFVNDKYRSLNVPLSSRELSAYSRAVDNLQSGKWTKSQFMSFLDRQKNIDRNHWKMANLYKKVYKDY